MIEVIIEDDINGGEAYVKIVPKEGPYSREWRIPLTILAKSGKKTIFEVNFFDENGLIYMPFHLWLDFRNSIYVKTKSLNVRTVLETTIKEKVIFVD